MTTEREIITIEALQRQLTENGYKIQQVLTELQMHKEKLEGAFPLDERGNPDYAKHKAQHQDISREKEEMIEYKKAVTLRLLQGGVGLIIMLISMALAPNIRELLSKI